MKVTNNYITGWPEKRKRLKQKYPSLSEDDLAYVAGREEELFRRIGRRLGASREQARHILRKI